LYIDEDKFLRVHEPSMVGLMVWVELSSWRPMMVGESKGRENQGQKWFQLEAPDSKQQVWTARAVMLRPQ
jgi:hypothetical protein